MHIFLFLFFLLVSSKNITWTGTHDCYWHNPHNWQPPQIPSSSDNIYIGWNATYAPYANKPIYGKLLINTFLLDIYETTAIFSEIENRGDFNVYASTLQTQSINNTGRFKIIETLIMVNTFYNLYQVSGQGEIKGRLLNYHTLRLEPNHSLKITNLIQSKKANTVIYLGNNTIVADELKLQGSLYVYSFGLKHVKQEIYKFRAGDIDVTLVPLNHNTMGNLEIDKNKIFVVLMKN